MSRSLLDIARTAYRDGRVSITYKDMDALSPTELTDRFGELAGAFSFRNITFVWQYASNRGWVARSDAYSPRASFELFVVEDQVEAEEGAERGGR